MAFQPEAKVMAIWQNISLIQWKSKATGRKQLEIDRNVCRYQLQETTLLLQSFVSMKFCLAHVCSQPWAQPRNLMCFWRKGEKTRDCDSCWPQTLLFMLRCQRASWSIMLVSRWLSSLDEANDSTHAIAFNQPSTQHSNPMDLADTCVKHQKRLYVCQGLVPPNTKCAYTCVTLRLPSPQRSSLRSLTFAHFARTFFFNRLNWYCFVV